MKHHSFLKRAFALLLAFAAFVSFACVEPTSTIIFENGEATKAPTAKPTVTVTATPVPAKTEQPTERPTSEPTEAPQPTQKPTAVPETFFFGGAELPAGLTVIDRSTKDEKGNYVTGTREHPKHITKKEVDALVALCPHLTRFVLEFCYFDDYEPLGKLTELQTLSLMSFGDEEGDEMLTDIGWISSLTELRRLNLCYNAIDDIGALSELYSLEYINLADNPLENDDLEALTHLYNLTNLDFYYLSGITDVSPLAEIESLSYLHLGYDSGIKSVEPLKKLKNLTRLRLNSTNVQDISYFGSFKALEYLDLSDCERDAESYKVLKDCPKLKAVAIKNASAKIKNVFASMSGVSLSNGWDGNWNY